MISKQLGDEDAKTPSTSSSVTKGFNYTPLTSKQKRLWKIKSESKFKYYYSNTRVMLKDFTKWLQKSRSKSEKDAKQVVAFLESVWKCLDPDMSLAPNRLNDIELLEDKFFEQRILTLVV